MYYALLWHIKLLSNSVAKNGEKERLEERRWEGAGGGGGGGGGGGC